MPARSEIQVNTYTNYSQGGAGITTLEDGGWVITWSSQEQDGYADGVFGQVFNADGTPRGGEFQVNTYTSQEQHNCSVAALSDGGWVVTWESFYQDGASYEIYAQAFNADGTPQGEEFRVNTTMESSQFEPAVTGLNDGGWVVTWVSQDPEYQVDREIYAQAFNADGTPRGEEFVVNTTYTYDQENPSVTALADGGWVITWDSDTMQAGTTGVFGQAYNADGSARGVEFEVNTYTTSRHMEPSVAALSDDGWVVTWRSYEQDGSMYGVYGQAFNADGTPQGDEFQVNTYTDANQYSSSVTGLADGGWVVTWTSVDQDGSGTGVFAQVYDSEGIPQGGEFRVNQTTDGNQTVPTVTATNDGGFVVAWQSLNVDGNGFAVVSRTFTPFDPAELAGVSPEISGSAEVGGTLTASLPGLDLTDETFDVTYVWYRDGEEFAATSDGGVTLTENELGAEITAVIQVEDTVFGASALTASEPTNPVDPANSDPTGSVELLRSNPDSEVFDTGDTVTADTSALEDADGLGTLSYQWYRSGEAIEGAAEASYLLTPADAGHDIAVVVSYTDGAGKDETVTSGTARVEGYTGMDLMGTAGADRLIGTALDDRLDGAGRSDVLVGRAGDDELLGGAGNDALAGGAGDDWLSGGGGDDIYSGVVGADVFVFSATGGNDIIVDFEDGIDRIELSPGPFAFVSPAAVQDGDDVAITHAAGSLRLLDMQLADLDASDFIF